MPNIRSFVAGGITIGAFLATGALLASGFVTVQLAETRVATEVQPVAVTRNLVCSGNVIAASSESATWTTIAKTALGIANGHELDTLATESDRDGSVVSYDDTPENVAATESVAVKKDVAAGYVATECGDPVNSQWLVGGSTTTGRDGVLTISNSSPVEARIDLEFWGVEGRISAPASSGIVIAAGSQKSYSLAGFAPNEAAPVVHVTSSGAAVWATLQMSTTRGLDPSGLDRISGVSGTSTNIVIPVVREPAEDVIGALRAGDGGEDVATRLRLLAPDGTDTTATITLSQADGAVPVQLTADLTANKVFEVPLDELVTGDFTVFVTSDVPLLASVNFSAYSTQSSILDFAWAVGISATNGPAASYVPADNSTLSIANPSDTELSVTVSGTGAETTIVVPPRSARMMRVDRGALRLDSTSPFAASVLVQKTGGIAVMRIPTEPLGARSVTVIAH